MFKQFGNDKAVFVNQDEGTFVAWPIALDSNALSLETETVGGRTLVKAGSVVKEGTVVRGITAESYDITDGPVAGRIVLEGYCWASRLTAAALAAVSALPKIVLMPYKAVVLQIVEEDTTNHKVTLRVEGSRFATTAAASDFTISGLTLVSGEGATPVTVNADGSITLEFTAGGAGSITAIASTAFVGASGSALKGLPLAINA